MFIITDRTEAIRDFIINDLERGGTCFAGTGLYKGVERKMIYVTLERSDLVKLKSNIRRLDPDAFINIIESSEIMGFGFKSLPESN
ncbi:MAG: YitT family protein [Bacteroidales bacterium]|nr:YitT family protein [Bacteroidales bacterium]